MSKRRTVVPRNMKTSCTTSSTSRRGCAWERPSTARVRSGTASTGSSIPTPPCNSTQAFENVRSRARQGQAPRFQDVVEITSYHVGLNEHIGLFMQVKDGFVKDPYPAWTAVGVSELAFGALVEIKVTAHLRG